MNIEMLKKEVHATCPEHGAFVGFQINLPNLAYTRKPQCPICAKLKAEKRVETDKVAKEFGIKKRTIESGIPLRFRGSSFGSFNPLSDKDALRLDALKDYSSKFDAIKSSNLFLSGGVGLGKTHLGCALARNLIAKGHSVAYVNTTSLFLEYKEATIVKNEAHSEVIKFYASCKLLILDEFGLAKFTDFEQNILHVILNARYENMLPTMIVGNVHFETIGDLLGERISRRLESSCLNITLDGGVSHG